MAPQVESADDESRRVDSSKNAGRVKTYLWEPLHKEGILDRAFRQSEFLPYLERMSEFIEIAASEDISGVTKKFPISEDSAFTWLQRKLRGEVDTHKSTDFVGAASRAFQTGSTEWAAKLLGKKDPTKFKVRDIVEVVRSKTDMALILLADRILLRFGERVLAGALPGGDSNLKMLDYFMEEYAKQHDSFIKTHNKASMWGSKTLAKTVKEYEQALLAS